MPATTAPLVTPERLARRTTDGVLGKLERDRLITTLILAATLHGLVILGVSFAAPSHGDGASRGLEVLLVSDELPEARRNDNATYLSQRTQTGSGNSLERLPAQLPAKTQPAAAEDRAEAARQAVPVEQLLATSSAGGRTRLQMVALPDPADAQATPASQPADPQTREEALRLRGAVRDELYITPDTRISRLAPYLDGWRRRVERIGTINYPSVAQRRGLSGNPVIEVALRRDGTLQSTRIQHSSGHPEIDAAALDILRLASPFEPFPPDVARDYRVLRFAYEWRFEGAGKAPGIVTIP